MQTSRNSTQRFFIDLGESLKSQTDICVKRQVYLVKFQNFTSNFKTTQGQAPWNGNKGISFRHCWQTQGEDELTNITRPSDLVNVHLHQGSANKAADKHFWEGKHCRVPSRSDRGWSLWIGCIIVRQFASYTKQNGEGSALVCRDGSVAQALFKINTTVKGRTLLRNCLENCHVVVTNTTIFSCQI